MVVLVHSAKGVSGSSRFNSPITRVVTLWLAKSHWNCPPKNENFSCHGDCPWCCQKLRSEQINHTIIFGVVLSLLSLNLVHYVYVTAAETIRRV